MQCFIYTDKLNYSWIGGLCGGEGGKGKLFGTKRERRNSQDKINALERLGEHRLCAVE